MWLVSVFQIFELYNKIVTISVLQMLLFFVYYHTLFLLIHTLKILFEITKYSASFQDDSETMIQSDTYNLVDRTLYQTTFPLLLHVFVNKR